MTRKDYVALAGALNRTLSYAHERENDEAAIGVENAACAVGDVLATDNPRFDRDRWADAVTKGVPVLSLRWERFLRGQS